MVSAPGSTRTLNVLIGRSGTEESFSQLAEGLRGEGFKVSENKTSPVGAHDTTTAVRDALRNVDVVLLVVHRADGASDSTTSFDRVLQDAEIIEDSIGDGKVLLLVEESVDGLPETGIGKVRFPSSRADMALQDVVNKIGSGLPPAPAERDLHARVPMSDQARSRALRVPWLLVTVILVSAAIPLFVALTSWGGDDLETVTLSGVSDGLKQTRPPVDGTDLGLNPQAGIDGDEQLAPAGAVVADAPASPAAVGGSNALLPASCEVNLRKDSLLDGAFQCSSVGKLAIEGLVGPWHNDIRAIAVGEGVVADLHMELRSDGSTNGPPVIGLASGSSAAVDPQDSAFGAEKLIARFSANNQHVHLFRNADGTGEFVTLTFVLD